MREDRQGSQSFAPVLIRSFDGSQIAVRSAGMQTRGTILFANAVGATLSPWTKPLQGLARERRWVTWDLRGLNDSPPPLTEKLDPATHAADAVAVADHFELDRFAMVTWSNGGRIGLEVAARFPDRVQELVVINGSYGRSPASLVRELDPSSALPVVAGVAKRFPAFAGMALRTLAGRPELAGVIRQSGLLAPSVDPYPLIETLQAMAACDPQRLLATFEAVAGSPAAGLLPSIEVPTLLIKGSRDWLSPRRLTEEMQQLIPELRVLIYEGASHYLPLEQPARLVEDLEAFLSRR